MPDLSAISAGAGSQSYVEVHTSMNGTDGTSVVNVSTDINGVHEERTLSGQGDINISTSSPDGRAQARVEVHIGGSGTSSIRVYPYIRTTRDLWQVQPASGTKLPRLLHPRRARHHPVTQGVLGLK